jgi:hypothetical protein
MRAIVFDAHQSLRPCTANYDPAGMHAWANVGQQSVLTAGQQNVMTSSRCDDQPPKAR